MSVLTTAARKRLPDSDFAGPDRSYPMPDRAHAANAKARAAQEFKRGALSAEMKGHIDKMADHILSHGR